MDKSVIIRGMLDVMKFFGGELHFFGGFRRSKTFGDGSRSVPGARLSLALLRNEPLKVGQMDHSFTIEDPSSVVNPVENENISESYRLLQTTLYRDSNGIALVLRFAVDSGPKPSNSSVQGEIIPKGEIQSPATVEILTTEQVAKELGLAPKTVRKLITDGFLEALPGVRPYRVTREALDRYLRGRSPRKDADPSSSNGGSTSTPPCKTGRRPLTRGTAHSTRSREDEVQRAVEDMKSWED